MLTPQECEFRNTSLNFLGKTIASKGLTQETAKIKNFREQKKIPATVRQVYQLIGFVLFLRTFVPNLAQNLMPWYILFRRDAVFSLSDDLCRSFEILNKESSQATITFLRLSKPGQQKVILLTRANT